MATPLTFASPQTAGIEGVPPAPCSCCGKGKKFDHFYLLSNLQEPTDITADFLTDFIRQVEVGEKKYLERRKQNGDLAQTALLDLGNDPLAIVCTTQMVHILRCFYNNIGVFNQNVGRFVIIDGKDDDSCYNIGDTVPMDVVHN